MTTNNSKQRLIAIASVIIVLLLGVNIFLLVNNMNKGKALEEKTVALTESEQLRDSLENQYNQAILELDQMKGTNAELNSIIEQQKAELGEQKNKIAGLINNKKDLARAREEIKNLTTQVQDYVAQIENLKSENQSLTDQNTQLSTDLSSQRMQNEELSTAKAALVSEKQQLETERSALSEKVNFASVVKVDGIQATGYKEKDSGKLSKKKYAKNVEVLDVCFNTTVNKVAESGKERFYVRIINPVGETISIDELGSGVIRSKETGSEIRYTQMIEETYNNDAQKVCFKWENPNGFQKGTYEVEIYNKGFLAGKGNFRLK
ncbi:MAG TPA: hypothetical protein PKC40_09730 [Saprospiraceae bacterium]|nr:hypothetical protein [Saprospiraceae bacterium]